MSKNEINRIKIYIILLIATLCVLGIYVTVTYNSNQVVRKIDYATITDTEGLDCLVEIKPRGGSTDAWIKNVHENGRIVQYAGIIYDIQVTNMTELEIRDWKVRVNVPRQCYINNAWCGQIEFHQNLAVEEKVQTLDLRKCYEDKVVFEVDAQYLESDLMIPMYLEDYFYYVPSIKDKEDFILPSSIEDGVHQIKRVDFIAYHKTYNDDISPMEFPSFEITYKLCTNIVEQLVFWILILLSVAWCSAIFNTYVIYRKTRRLLEKTKCDAQIIEQSMSAFVQFIDAKDPSTQGHSRRVAMYARKLGEKIGLSSSECERLYYIALMHDCGKIGIPDSILKKPDKLTEEEFEIIKKHTTMGKKILNDFTSIDGIIDGAMYHHERFDGKGYPCGLKGKEIPLIARIICIADSFDVMNSERCYKKRTDEKDIIEQIVVNKGTQFDPELADIFLKMISDKEIEF